MKCPRPRDRTQLKLVDGPVECMRHCPECRGVWGQNAMQGRRLSADIADTNSMEPVAGGRHPPISCPLDHTLMTQKLYHDIQVDICKKHKAMGDGDEYVKRNILTRYGL